MIQYSLLPRKGENEIFFTHLGEGILGVRSQSWSSELELEVGIRGQYAGVRGQSWSSELELESGGGDLIGVGGVSNFFCFDFAKDITLKDARRTKELLLGKIKGQTFF